MIGNPDELRYEGGYPKAESIRKPYDQLDRQQTGPAVIEVPPKVLITESIRRFILQPREQLRPE